MCASWSAAAASSSSCGASGRRISSAIVYRSNCTCSPPSAGRVECSFEREQQPLQHLSAKGGRGSQVERQVELRPLVVEVLVELAPHRVDRLRCPEHPDSEVVRELLRCAVELRVVGDPAEAAIGGRDEQRPDRRFGEVVSDVEQAGLGGGLTEAAVERGGEGHCI